MNQLKSPYGVLKTLDWLWNYVKGGNHTNSTSMTDIPKSYVLSQKQADCTVAFIGDLMGTSGKRLKFSSSLIQWFQDANLIVANLEGPLVETNDLVFIKQHNSPQLLRDLSAILPMNQWAFSLANNHTFDYGQNGLDLTQKIIADSGAQCFGLDSCPNLELNDLCIWGAADFSNVKNDSVLFNSKLSNKSDFNPQKYQILFTHWGQEFYFYPSDKQRLHRNQEFKNFDFLIGHHSHTAQPIVFENHRGTAYSLGNFYIYFNKEMMKKGKALKLHFSGKELVKITWEWTQVVQISKSEIQIDLGQG
jgi:poly-gamma-glutamate capsule biosynthesis protein CapA/YwtB (metallophosphatase superfamily)